MSSYEVVSILIAFIGTLSLIVGYFLTHPKTGERQ